MSAEREAGPGSPPPDLLAALEQRTGGSGFIRQALRYVFPDHWSFLLGEIALYSFVVLIGTGIFLALFFDASIAETTYHGSYVPLAGQTMSRAYASGLSLSFDVDGGLLMRQTHHWAALVFIASIVLHMLRIFFTGAFRKPRDINYLIGLTMLVFAILEGYAGYSLLDDLLSGMGLAIGYGAALSIPVVGGDVSSLIWDGQFPGSSAFLSRLFISHVLILPIIIAALIAAHLFFVARPHHTQFRGRGRKESNVVGTPLWPAYALRGLGLMLATVSVLLLLGGLVQINPIWLWGPYETFQATNGAQPDWYLGWLIGALRLMPSLEVTIGSYTLVPNPFFGGILFPGALFTFLYAYPWLERRFTGDYAQHNLLDRPRDAPRRTAIGVAVFTLVATVFFAGAADRAFVQVGINYEVQVWIYRALFLLLPPLTYWLTVRICRRLLDRDTHPARPSPEVVRRNLRGGFTSSQE